MDVPWVDITRAIILLSKCLKMEKKLWAYYYGSSPPLTAVRACNTPHKTQQQQLVSNSPLVKDFALILESQSPQFLPVNFILSFRIRLLTVLFRKHILHRARLEWHIVFPIQILRVSTRKPPPPPPPPQLPSSYHNHIQFHPTARRSLHEQCKHPSEYRSTFSRCICAR